MLLTRKQTKGETLDHFYGKLKVLSENCELGNQKNTLIRDLFTANMQDSEIQKELLKETVKSLQAWRWAVNMELVSKTNYKSLTVSLIYNWTLY